MRKDSLVYAVGSGNSGDSNWIFNRSNDDVQADDIGTWGSVLRISGIETDVLTFDPSAHTVTVKAPVTTISSVADYTKTAINMQLNSGNKGALNFADSTNTKSALLGTNLSFSGTINLSGSGNIGLMRDDYKDNINEIGSYTKTISGGTVNLAIGERYGVYSGSNSVGRGAIVAHRYNGLIARTGEVFTNNNGEPLEANPEYNMVVCNYSQGDKATWYTANDINYSITAKLLLNEKYTSADIENGVDPSLLGEYKTPTSADIGSLKFGIKHLNDADYTYFSSNQLIITLPTTAG